MSKKGGNRSSPGEDAALVPGNTEHVNTMTKLKTSKSWAKAFALAATLPLGLASSSLSAADLGGDCCADLEERVAELEATTARKGNRKVSLQISGQVTQTLMYWDDGVASDLYVTDSGNVSSRWRMRGSAKISPDITAGFLYEFGAVSSSTLAVNQTNGGDDLGGGISLRDATAWLRHTRLGRVQIGHGSTATDNLILLDLSGSGAARTPDTSLYGGAMINRLGTGGAGQISFGGAPTNLTWRRLMIGDESWDTSRRDHILYETPAIAGFFVQAAWGEDDFWDVALKYAGEFNGVRLTFGIGYRENKEFDGLAGQLVCTANCRKEDSNILGSLSIRHMPTGLFFTGAGGSREVRHDDQIAATLGQNKTEPYFYYLSGGIARNLFGIGDTVVYGEYSEHRDFVEGNLVNVGGGLVAATGSDVQHWGIGIHQHVDAAAMEFFLTYKNYSVDIDLLAGPRANLRDLHLVIAGTRIQF